MNEGRSSKTVKATRNLRHDARSAVARARGHLAAGDETRLPYACLDLRFAIEFITYSLLQTYLEEVPEDTLKKWTPREVINELLDADENADQSVRLFVGIEPEYGVPPATMNDLGQERRLTKKEIVKFHNAMGNFLHAPTLEQLEAGRAASPDTVRVKASEVADALDEVLDSPVFNLNFGNFVEFTCCECKSPIKRKVEAIDRQAGITCRAAKCGAIFDMREGGEKPVFSLRQTSGPCPKCSEAWTIPVHKIAAGLVLSCHCGSKYQVVYTIKELPPPGLDSRATP